MINKLKQYKFSPRTKEEMKNDFKFMDEPINQEQPEVQVENNNKITPEQPEVQVENNNQTTPEQPQNTNNNEVTESQKEE